MEFKQTITPVLRILDVEKAIGFYVDWLGFSIDWEQRFGENFPLYCQASRKDIIIHLTEHVGDCIPGARIRIHIRDIAEYHRMLIEKNYRYYKPGFKKTDWGTIEMPLVDPFGNHIVFVEDIED